MIANRSTELARTRRRLAAEREAEASGQSNLFQNPAPRRASNPPCTSRAAFETVSSSGIRSNQKLQLVEWLRDQNEPLTSAEIAAQSGMERHGAARRLPNAERDQMVRRCAARRCRQTGFMAITWEAI